MAPDAQSDELSSDLISDDPWKTNAREYRGLNFSVLKSESIFGYLFWRCKCGLGCTKWRIDFGIHFRRFVKNEWTQISGAELFGFEIWEHIWIHFENVLKCFTSFWKGFKNVLKHFKPFLKYCKSFLKTFLNRFKTLLKRFKMLYKFLKRI